MLWSVTCHFNPCGYRRRRENYHRFRRSLRLPLLTVELSFDGRFELGPDDADILIPLHGGDVMWQKERLLNIAVSNLPPECRKLMWIDGDVIVLDPEWTDKIEAALDRYPLIQPYNRTVLLRPNEPPSDEPNAGELRLQSFARYHASQQDSAIPKLSDCRQAGYSPGMCWCIDRDIVESCGLYDGMILGAADIAMAQAAAGRAAEIIAEYDFSPAHSEHYRRWSEQYHDEIQGRIGFVDSTVFHLWHGDMIHRGYETRYSRFGRFDFDPQTDLATDPATKCWRWNSPKPELHRYVREYFSQRREDG